jgi:hypothetical protein
MKILQFFRISACIAFFCVSLFAQPIAWDANVPFANGETLVYEGKISKSILRGIAIGDISFTVARSEPGDYLLKAEARSKSTLLKLFRYSLLQEVQTTIAGQEFKALRTVKHDVQKDRIRNSEALFDYKEERVTYVESDPNEPMRAPRRIASELAGPTHDLLSGLYTLRLLPLAVGRTFELAVSDSGLVYKIPVRVAAREKQKSVLGNTWCYRVEPDVFGPGRLVESEGSMVIWITDDAKRIPVRAVIKAPIGKLDIKLRSSGKVK